MVTETGPTHLGIPLLRGARKMDEIWRWCIKLVQLFGGGARLQRRAMGRKETLGQEYALAPLLYVDELSIKLSTYQNRTNPFSFVLLFAPCSRLEPHSLLFALLCPDNLYNSKQHRRTTASRVQALALGGR